MSGAQVTSTPLRQGVTPLGKPRSSRNTVELVVVAVAVGVFQTAHAAAVLALAVDAARIVAHLDDPQLAVRPPGHRDRIRHQRLGRDQLDLKARPSVRHGQRLRGRLRTGKQHVLAADRRAACDRPGRAACRCLRSAPTACGRESRRRCSCPLRAIIGIALGIAPLARRPAAATSPSRPTRTGGPRSRSRWRR